MVEDPAVTVFVATTLVTTSSEAFVEAPVVGVEGVCRAMNGWIDSGRGEATQNIIHIL